MAIKPDQIKQRGIYELKGVVLAIVAGTSYTPGKDSKRLIHYTKLTDPEADVYTLEETVFCKHANTIDVTTITYKKP